MLLAKNIPYCVYIILSQSYIYIYSILLSADPYLSAIPPVVCEAVVQCINQLLVLYPPPPPHLLVTLLPPSDPLASWASFLLTKLVPPPFSYKKLCRLKIMSFGVPMLAKCTFGKIFYQFILPRCDHVCRIPLCQLLFYAHYIS